MHPVSVELWRQDAVLLIGIGQRLWGDADDLRIESQQISRKLSNFCRRIGNFGGDNLGDDRLEATNAEVLDERIRPAGELRVEAATQDRSIHVDALGFHGCILHPVAIYAKRFVELMAIRALSW